MRLTYHPVVTTVLLNVIFASILLLPAIARRRRRRTTSGCSGVYAAFLLFLAYRAFWLKLRVADLTDTAAMKCGLAHITGRRKKATPAVAGETAAPAATERERQTAGTATSVSPQPSATDRPLSATPAAPDDGVPSMGIFVASEVGLCRPSETGCRNAATITWVACVSWPLCW